MLERKFTESLEKFLLHETRKILLVNGRTGRIKKARINFQLTFRKERNQKSEAS